MSTLRDPDAILGAWLDESAVPLPAETRRAIEVAIRTIPQQRRSRWLPRRYPFMTTPLRLAATALAVLVVAFGTLLYLRPASDPGLGAQPIASPTANGSAMPDPSTWTSYTSAEHGFEVSHPADWDAYPKEGEVWFSGGPPNTWSSGITVRRYAGDGLDQEAWIEANCGVRNGTFGNVADVIALPPCEPPSAWASTNVDGHAALWHLDDACCLDTVVFVGDNVYVITATSSFAADRPLVDAFLSTLRLQQ
jgi:hypothetical protein